MASQNPLLFLLLLLLTAIFSGHVSAGHSSDLVAELVALRSRSASGVIHLDDAAVSRFISSVPSPRPYSFLVFFDAAQLRSNPDLHLAKLRSEFALLSASFLSYNPSSSDLFFADIEFKESQHSFSLFEVSSLPHVRLIGPADASLRDSVPMDQSHFSRLAESMAEFVESRTGLSVGPIARPPPVSGRQVAILIALLVILSPFLIKRILKGDTILHDPNVWMGSAIFVYFFSVSGAMHNIIRGMPMFLSDRNDPNRMVFFYQGSGMQLGAEGFAVGFLYTIVGLMIAVVTHGLVKVRSLATQRMCMLVVMVVACWAVNKVVYLDNWKTGYSIHAFWPNSWR
ncbi:probable dolichyl-diphosphooligosaccharide--protein glycosyltransferase subunit 3 [Typha latifolia]|uniref:probable dolichyl-diphosphooligosaccharide--protein glycosyltransferase subunit 3 n=1 Tax=Typha latifolia TaxID=4733 RepID=UPI003C2E73D5